MAKASSLTHLRPFGIRGLAGQGDLPTVEAGPGLGAFELQPGLEPGFSPHRAPPHLPERGPAALELLKVLHAALMARRVERVLFPRTVPKSKTRWKLFLSPYNIHTLLKFLSNGLNLKSED